MEKQVISEGSNYHLRQLYLQTLRQALAEDLEISPSHTQRGLEEYFSYEKELSAYVQTLLAHACRNSPIRSS